MSGSGSGPRGGMRSGSDPGCGSGSGLGPGCGPGILSRSFDIGCTHGGTRICESAGYCCKISITLNGPIFLSDGQDESVASPAARAPQRSRVPARSVDRHLCCSGSGDHGGSDRDFQLRTGARDGSDSNCPSRSQEKTPSPPQTRYCLHVFHSNEAFIAYELRRN